MDSHGNICLDILKEEWSACYNVSTILLSIQSLLGEPNPDSPLNAIAADLSKRSAEGFFFFVFCFFLFFVFCLIVFLFIVVLHNYSNMRQKLYFPFLTLLPPEYKAAVVSKYKEFQAASKCK